MDKHIPTLLECALILREKSLALENHARQVLYVEVSKIRDEVNEISARAKMLADLVEHMAKVTP